MSFNKEFWKNLCFITNEEFLHINCPRCKKGYLKPVKESFRSQSIFSKHRDNSCANKIRICIEVLMDEMKIKKTSIDNGKRRMLTLH